MERNNEIRMVHSSRVRQASGVCRVGWPGTLGQQGKGSADETTKAPALFAKRLYFQCVNEEALVHAVLSYHLSVFVCGCAVLSYNAMINNAFILSVVQRCLPESNTI